MPSKPAPSLVAVSGGRDSVALLHWLHAQGVPNLVVCHLNHGLRGRDSGQDAAFVRLLARRLNLPLEVRKVDAASHARKHQISIETAGRNLRHEFFRDMALKHGARQVYLAHHADDQAETILAHLCRGAGLDGIAGMKSLALMQVGPTELELHRPLLQWRRADIDHYVQQHGLRFREDRTNHENGPRRNRLRHEVLPLLNDIFSRDVAPIISRLGALAERDDEALWFQAMDLFKRHWQAGGEVRITTELKSAAPAVLSRLVLHWLRQLEQLNSITSSEVELAMSMLKPGGPAKINLPGGHHLRRKAGRWWLQRMPRSSADERRP